MNELLEELGIDPDFTPVDRFMELGDNYLIEVGFRMLDDDDD